VFFKGFPTKDWRKLEIFRDVIGRLELRHIFQPEVDLGLCAAVRLEDSQNLTSAILRAARVCLDGSFDQLLKALGDITRANLIIFPNMIGVRLRHAYSQ
jgi:hypothetical protein